MVQRMVDNLPATCEYGGCTAKLTRASRAEHLLKCEHQPEAKDRKPVCGKHGKPLSFFCTQVQCCCILACAL